MIDKTDVAQARELLKALRGQIAQISRKLEASERRADSGKPTGRPHEDQAKESTLRHDLYEAYRLVEGLHRRFPETRDAPDSRAT